MSTRRIVLMACAVVPGAMLALLFTGVSVRVHAAAKLVYADFELPLDQRPVSSRGGFIQLVGFQENAGHPMQFKGMDNQTPPAPAIKMTAKDGSNKAIAFEYALAGPNQWGGVSVEIHGLPDKDGKPQFDDVSGYKFLDLQIFTAEPTKMRVEFQSQNVGVSAQQPPQFGFRTKAGMNAYKVKLDDAVQPDWVDPKINPKDVLKHLTSVNIVVACDDCREQKGLVAIDNLVFEN
jgi:hypothetical protein